MTKNKKVIASHLKTFSQLLVCLFLFSISNNSLTAGEFQNPFTPPSTNVANQISFKNSCGLLFGNNSQILPNSEPKTITINEKLNLTIFVLSEERWTHLVSQINEDEVPYEIKNSKERPMWLGVAAYVYGFFAISYGSNYVLDAVSGNNLTRASNAPIIGGLILGSVYGAIFAPKLYYALINYYQKRRTLGNLKTIIIGTAVNNTTQRNAETQTITLVFRSSDYSYSLIESLEKELAKTFNFTIKLNP